MRVYAFLSVLSLFLLSLTLCLAETAYSANVLHWNVQIVDANANGILNGYCPITVDSNNIPHVAYTGLTPPYIYTILRYANWNGSGWSSHEIPYSRACDLVLDTDGTPHILYETGDALIYARWTGSEWAMKTVAANRVVYASLALDSSGNPRAAFTYGEGLKYASWTGSSWNVQTVDASPDIQIKLFLALDKNNTPYILYVTPSSYLDNSTGIDYPSIDVKLATYQNSSWSIQTVPLPPPTGDHGNIALDSKGYPHFVCLQSQPPAFIGTILYASWDGAAWSTQTVASNVSRGLSFGIGSLALDSHDRPHFNYITSSGDVMYTSLTGTSWNIQAVDTNTGAYGPCYLALDSNDNPHISYRGWFPGQETDGGRIAAILYATANVTEVIDSTQPPPPTFGPAQSPSPTAAESIEPALSPSASPTLEPTQTPSPTSPALPLTLVLTAVIIIGAVGTVLVYVWKKRLLSR